MTQSVFYKISAVLKRPTLLYDKLLWAYYFRELNRLFDQYFINNPEKQDSIILASYPKSGNTFFRFVWLNIIALEELHEREIDFNTLDTHLPYEGFFEDVKKEWQFKTLPCLLKTHCRYSDRYRTFRKIHLFRNPLDAMVSNFHYFAGRKGNPPGVHFSWIEKRIFNLPVRARRDFSDFLFRNFDDYCSHFRSWMESGASPASYETLVSENTGLYFSDILKSINVQVKEDILTKAIERSRKDKLKDKTPSERMARLNGTRFIRDGSTGQWRTYYGEKELEFVLRKLGLYKLDKKNQFPEKYRSFLIDWPTEAVLSDRSR